MTVKYPLASNSWNEEEPEAIKKLIDTGMLTMGKHVKELEREFAKYFGSKYCVRVNSGSSANLLMIASLFFRKHGTKLEKGDEVIVPAVSWSTTYHPLQQYGLKIKFVDVDINTLNFDLECLRNAITDKTKAVLAVNLLGNSNDFTKIQEIIDEVNPGIILLEDSCESMGTLFEGRQAGTFGLMGTYSGFFSHHINLIESGILITDDEELYEIATCLRAHGWTRNLKDVNLVSGEKSSDWFEETWKFVLPGYNLRPTEINAVAGLVQLKKLDSFIEQRRRNAYQFKKTIIKNYKKHFIFQKEIGNSSWFGFSMIVRPESNFKRSDVVKLLTEHGIECRPIVAGNFTKNPVMKYFDYEICGDLPNSNLIDTNGLFVGNHHYPMEEMFNELDKALSKLT